ncbi:unnamed protein product [Arabidopsis lyrata]|nr:unnamed protein product [Arabidopsis lyrata]
MMLSTSLVRSLKELMDSVMKGGIVGNKYNFLRRSVGSEAPGR